MDFDSPWVIEPFGNKGRVRAKHSSGVEILLSPSGWATVLHRPDDVPEIMARRLMDEAVDWVAERTKH